ncbi:MAG: sensor histidine kinase [Sphingosinicella sp.]
MRFDDSLATALAAPVEREDQLALKWRQLVDLLAQGRRQPDLLLSEQAFAFLREHRWQISQARRRDAAIALSGHSVTPDLVEFFSGDVAPVAAPLIASARLDTKEWLALLPRLGPTARALLRHRRDLPVPVEEALAGFGASDFVLESAVSAAARPAADASAMAGEPEAAEPGERVTQSDLESPADTDAPAEATVLAEAEFPAGPPAVGESETAAAVPEPAAPAPAPAPAEDASPPLFDWAVPPAPDEPAPDLDPRSAPAGEGQSQIQELVERIEAFRQHRTPPPTAPQGDDGFRWETGADGTLRWIEGAPREALVGLSIAAIAGRGGYGVDGQAAGAFAKRDPFRDARFTVAGEGPAAGAWRISGVPFFDTQRGSFLGYRGTARRPRLDENAGAGGEPGLFGPDFPADSLRQLVHELRTPLNAIIGFSEMIEGQYLGPAARGYRGSAAEIREQARRLLAAVDDLDTAARIESRGMVLGESAVDAAALVARLAHSYGRVAAERGTRLTLEMSTGLPLAQVEAAATDRMVSRLLAAAIGVANPGETIATRLFVEHRAGRPMLCLQVTRPGAIAGLTDADLLDPGYSPEGDWPDAPVLGLGFALRLVRNLAEAAGGSLLIGPTEIQLYLPARVDAAPAVDGGGIGA